MHLTRNGPKRAGSTASLGRQAGTPGSCRGPLLPTKRPYLRVVLALVVALVDVVLVATTLARAVLRLGSVPVAAPVVRDAGGGGPACQQRSEEQCHDA